MLHIAFGGVGAAWWGAGVIQPHQTSSILYTTQLSTGLTPHSTFTARLSHARQLHRPAYPVARPPYHAHPISYHITAADMTSQLVDLRTPGLSSWIKHLDNDFKPEPSLELYIKCAIHMQLSDGANLTFQCVPQPPQAALSSESDSLCERNRSAYPPTHRAP